ncbi:MAG TPA: hypothetical protein VEU47_09515 [Candidatus Cybelea sp.]|nr:hypothetical protein [Candidatus Cybelea sp.]
MAEELHPDVASQIDALDLVKGRPLIVSDADEVLFAFMAGFERHLEASDLYFHWGSYALTGNVRRRHDDEPLSGEAVREVLARFFASETESLDPVPGAADALKALSARAQIVVLSNVPLDQRDARRRALARHGMDYPLIANIGGKGEAVRALEARVEAPVVFLDDIPRQHTSVRGSAAATLCVHLVADPRLAKLLGQADDSDHRVDNWPDARAWIEAALDRLGY